MRVVEVLLWIQFNSPVYGIIKGLKQRSPSRKTLEQLCYPCLCLILRLSWKSFTTKETSLQPMKSSWTIHLPGHAWSVISWWLCLPFLMSFPEAVDFNTLAFGIVYFFLLKSMPLQSNTDNINTETSWATLTISLRWMYLKQIVDLVFWCSLFV